MVETLEVVPALPDHGPARLRLELRRRQGAATRSRSSSSATSTIDTRSSRTGSSWKEVNHGFEILHAQDGIRSVIQFDALRG